MAMFHSYVKLPEGKLRRHAGTHHRLNEQGSHPTESYLRQQMRNKCYRHTLKMRSRFGSVMFCDVLCKDAIAIIV